MAASCGNRGAVSVLLELNADPEATDRKGRVAGQSFLRQVTRRARADIRASLAAAVERIHAPPAAADGGSEDDDLDVDGGGLPPMPGGMKRATSTASCESAEPVRRPSMLSLLQIGGWGGGGGGDASGRGGGETSFSGAPAVVSC